MSSSPDIKFGSDHGRAIYDLVKGFIGLLSPEGTLLDANRSALDFVGVSLQEVVGTPFWKTPWWSDCQSSQEAVKEAVRRGASGEFSRFEARHTGKNGEIVDVDFSLSPIFNDSGVIISLVAEAHNITSTKKAAEALFESEARLRLAYDAAGIGTWDWDLTSDLLQWNDRQFELFGISKPAGQMNLGRAIAVIHPDDRERALAENRASFENNLPFRTEFRVIHQNGEVRWLAGQGTTLHHDDDSKAKSMIGVNYDITNLKNIEAKLAKNNLELEERVAERTRLLEQEILERQEVQKQLSHSRRLEAIGQLAGGMAHDFNNLLAVIGGNLELATMRAVDIQAKELIQEALDAVEAGASLNKRLLSFARTRPLKPEKFTINARVQNMIHLMERTLDENITLDIKLSPQIWETLIDPGEFDGALLNLVINARDAMPSGGELSISSRNQTFSADDVKSIPEAQQLEYVLLCVSDTGTGMTPEVLEQAFVPFFTTKERGKGSGLGLSSVFGFARQSGGFIKIESVEGKGTTINIYLPNASTPSNETMTKSPESGMPSGQGELILVVDDDKAVLRVTCKRLVELGYNAIEATTAAEAIELLETNETISLVLSDVRMPGEMSGYDLAKWLFVNRPQTAILLTSGYNDEAAGENANVKILAKPCSIRELAISLHDTLV